MRGLSDGQSPNCISASGKTHGSPSGPSVIEMLYSRPSTNSSANHLPPKRLALSSARAITSLPRQTQPSSRPTDASSRVDFTMYILSSWRPFQSGPSHQSAVGLPASRIRRMVSGLSVVTAMPTASTPVKMTPASSSMRGAMGASAPRPSMPSTMLKTMSAVWASRMAWSLSGSGEKAARSTAWPFLRSASATAFDEVMVAISSGGGFSPMSECRTRMRMLFSLRLFERRVALAERRHDLPDELVIRDSLACRDKAHVRIFGAQAGERVHFDVVWDLVGVIADVDAAAVETAHSLPGAQRDVARLLRIGWGCTVVVVSVVPVFFVY